MRMRSVCLVCTWVVGLVAAVPGTWGAPVGTAFTYQGQLRSGGAVADGYYDFDFLLYSTATGGAYVASYSPVAVSVNKGLFTVQLDFGQLIDGNARWLEVRVAPAGSGIYTTLSPRQALTAVPYALYATGNWGLGGNAGTTAGADFLGTTDNQPLEIKVNGTRVLRLEPNATSPNIIGGHPSNTVTAGVYGATISGGGVANYSNRVTDDCGTIGGGADNTAGYCATVGGGSDNTASYQSATVSGGSNNTASGLYATVGGGSANTASHNYATVCGGANNTASFSCATVGGGYRNQAGGNYSWAAGQRAKVRSKDQVGGGDIDGDQGTFVWADSTDADFISTGPNQFLIRASGGVGIGTNSPAARLDVVGDAVSQVLNVTLNNSAGGWPPTAAINGTVNATSMASNWVNGINGSAGGGSATANKRGIYGQATGPGNNYGVYGWASGGTINWAGFFDGDVNVNGKVAVGGGIKFPDGSVQSTAATSTAAGAVNPLQAALLRWYGANQVTAFAVGTHPVGVAFDGANVWVANQNNNNVTKLRANDGAVVGTYNVGTGPIGVAFDGANIWVTNYNSNNVTKLRARDGAALGTYVVGAYPMGIAFDGANIWVANSGSNNVTKLASNGSAVGTYNVGTAPAGVAFDGTNVWVANHGSNNVTKLLASSGAVVSTYAAGTYPFAIAFDGANMWVASDGSGSVKKIRASDGAVQGTYSAGAAPRGVAFDGANIWVANSGSNNVTKLRASDGSVLGTYSAGTSPEAVAFDGVNIWVANAEGGTVSKL